MHQRVEAHAPLTLGLVELWRYRNLVNFLARRDVMVRYRQTLLGAAWALLQPLVTATLFLVVFGRLAQLPATGRPTVLFYLCALVPWNIFAAGVTQGSNSLVASASLLTKVYFPRLALPVASLAAPLVDAAVALCLATAFSIADARVSVRLLAVPLFVALAAVLTLSLALWLSALQVRFRDVRIIVPFLLQIWLFASPVVYSANMIPVRWRWLYALNPLVGIIEGMRWAFITEHPFPWLWLSRGLLVIAVVLAAGVLFFRHAERSFADYV